jgi:hypothetical protein
VGMGGAMRRNTGGEALPGAELNIGRHSGVQLERGECAGGAGGRGGVKEGTESEWTG